jgi:hypothetical protein
MRGVSQSPTPDLPRLLPTRPERRFAHLHTPPAANCHYFWCRTLEKVIDYQLDLLIRRSFEIIGQFAGVLFSFDENAQ